MNTNYPLNQSSEQCSFTASRPNPSPPGDIQLLIYSFFIPRRGVSQPLSYISYLHLYWLLNKRWEMWVVFHKTCGLVSPALPRLHSTPCNPTKIARGWIMQHALVSTICCRNNGLVSITNCDSEERREVSQGCAVSSVPWPQLWVFSYLFCASRVPRVNWRVCIKLQGSPLVRY